MSTLRKLANFRQMSLTCETPTHVEQRRKSLKKQFSEEIPDNWLDFKIAVNSKSRKSLEKPPTIKIAWEEDTKCFKTEDSVIIKKCTELKRPTTSKLMRQSSLENDSILCSKPKLLVHEPDKPNINIFLAYNSKDQNFEQELEKTPKIMSPLFLTDNKMNFQIRKNLKPKINLQESSYSPTNLEKIEKPKLVQQDKEVAPNVENREPNKEIHVFVRPLTAASKREKFQKRTNSAFTSLIKESNPSRPPLIRSSSAPCKPDQTKSKFVATKRKIKSAKRNHQKPQITHHEEIENHEEEPKSQKVLNRSISVNGSDIVTMVSLVSPDGSDVEETIEEPKEKEKAKPIIAGNKHNGKDSEVMKNLSLRKTVKSVTFQQSSIHAVRSFSASFPSRRGSVGSALMLNAKNAQKTNEKRSPVSNVSDDDDRGPKRKLIRSNTLGSETTQIHTEDPKNSEISTNDPNITVSLKEKPPIPDEPTDTNEEPQEAPAEEPEDDQPKFESAKEKQCWDMYCKMTEKGINVSYDTILRGMLTPTEYRLRRKDSISSPIVDDNR